MFFKRIVRAIKNIPWFLYESWTWEYESCKDCGKTFRVLWAVDDKTWKFVMGNAEGCFCVACFVKRANKVGLTLTKESFTIFEVFNP